VLLQHLVDHPFAVGRDPDVALVDAAARLAVRLQEALGGLGVVRVADGDAHPPVGQPVADRQADASGPAGYQRDLPFHVGHVTSLLVSWPVVWGWTVARPPQDGRRFGR
jgi:hypothetical protein